VTVKKRGDQETITFRQIVGLFETERPSLQEETTDEFE